MFCYKIFEIHIALSRHWQRLTMVTVTIHEPRKAGQFQPADFLDLFSLALDILVPFREFTCTVYCTIVVIDQ